MARERYLLHAGSETIHRQGEDKKPETPKKKWENFWYYHRLHVLIAAAVVLLAAVFIAQSLQTVKPDYTVGMITSTACSDSTIDALQTAMQKYGKDLNGDGRVTVQINQYTIAPSDSGTSSGLSGVNPEVQAAMQTKLVADLTTGTSIIFITDDASFRRQEQAGNHMFAYLDGSTPKDSAADYDKMRVSIEMSPGFPGLGLLGPTPSSGGGDAGYFISLRVYKGSAIEGKVGDYYQECKELFDKLTRGS